MKVWKMLPKGAERIRCLRVLREAYRRGVKPELKATYRKRAGKTYGPYYVAYFKRVRSKGFDMPRLIYLGKENESVNFVRWLEEQPEKKVVAMAKAILERAAGVLKKHLSNNGPTASPAEIARKLANISKNAPKAAADAVDDLAHYLGIIELLGRWKPWFIRHVRRWVRGGPPGSSPSRQTGGGSVGEILSQWKQVLGGE